MLNVILHGFFIMFVFYYVYINGTDYDRPFYQSVNEIHYYFYKKTKDTKKDIKKYEKDFDKSEKKRDRINKRKARCELCEEKTSSKKRKKCRKDNDCDHIDTIENFSNDGDDDNSKPIHSKHLFIEIKIVILMILCTLLASHQHYGMEKGELNIRTLFRGFRGGIENLMFLGYLIILLVFLYGELKELYGDNKKTHKD